MPSRITAAVTVTVAVTRYLSYVNCVKQRLIRTRRATLKIASIHGSFLWRSMATNGLHDLFT